MPKAPETGILHKAVLLVLDGVGSVYARQLSKAFESDGISAFARAKAPVASEYTTAYEFSGDYLAFNILRKLDVESDRDRLEQVAFAKFRESEKKNAITNQNLRKITGSESALSYAKKFISSCLGTFNVRRFALGCSWGPGSTASLPASVSTVDKKISEVRHSVTPNCMEIASLYLGVPSLWRDMLGFPSNSGPLCLMPGEFTLLDGGELTTVVKDFTARRTIDPQPTLNLFFQKSVGSMIREALRRHGLDLNQSEHNKRLASIAGSSRLCTIDLKDASNTLSYEVVRQLLPNDWFEMMDRLRTQYTYVDGVKHKFEMFSAMGNGFTFELESLIFYALSWAVVRCEFGDQESPIAVFGDDIIVASRYYQRLTTVLADCGFTVNVAKTFSEGPFYESCGGHYFDGHEVTPVFQKEDIVDCPSLIRFANRLVRWGIRVNATDTLDCRILDAYLFLAEELTKLHSEIEDARKASCLRYRRKFVYRPVPTQHYTHEGDLCLIDIDRTSLYSYEKITGWIYKPLQVPGRESALLVEALRSSYRELGEASLRRPYGLGLNDIAYPNGEIRQIRSQVPTYGKVVPRRNGKELGRYVWSDVHVYSRLGGACCERALGY